MKLLRGPKEEVEVRLEEGVEILPAHLRQRTRLVTVVASNSLPDDSAMRPLLAFVALQATRTLRVRENIEHFYSDTHLMLLNTLVDEPNAFANHARTVEPGISDDDIGEIVRSWPVPPVRIYYQPQPHAGPEAARQVTCAGRRFFCNRRGRWLLQAELRAS